MYKIIKELNKILLVLDVRDKIKIGIRFKKKLKYYFYFGVLFEIFSQI